MTSRVLSCPASSPRGGNRERRGSWIGSPRDPNGSLDKQVLDGWVSASSCPDGDFFLFCRVSQSLSIRMGSSLCRGAEFLSCLTACLFLLLRSEVFVVQITGVWLGHHSDPESSETLLIFFWLGFGTEIPYRFLDSCGHGGCGLCSRQSAVVLPHFQSIFPWISRSRRANHRFLILSFSLPRFSFEFSFACRVVLMPMCALLQIVVAR